MKKLAGPLEPQPAPLTAEPSCLVTASDDVITTHVPGRVCLVKRKGTRSTQLRAPGGQEGGGPWGCKLLGEEAGWDLGSGLSRHLQRLGAQILEEGEEARSSLGGNAGEEGPQP